MLPPRVARAAPASCRNVGQTSRFAGALWFVAQRAHPDDSQTKNTAFIVLDDLCILTDDLHLMMDDLGQTVQS